MVTATQSGYARRAGRVGAKGVNIEWFTDQFMQRMNTTMEQRMRKAVEYLQDKIVTNINVPVVKQVGVRSGRIVVTERSKPGEFPRADTTLLKQSIFHDIRKDTNTVIGYIGTPLDYSVILELRMDRSFLARTLNEELATLRAMFVEPIR